MGVFSKDRTLICGTDIGVSKMLVNLPVFSGCCKPNCILLFHIPHPCGKTSEYDRVQARYSRMKI